MPNEPVLTAGAVAGIVSSVMVMAVAMGWVQLSEDQQNAIMGVVALLAPIIAAVFARGMVTPVNKAE